MASERYEAGNRTVSFPRWTVCVCDGREEIRLHWNGRRGSRAAIELNAWDGEWASRTYRISLGDFLRGLGLTADDCRDALAVEPAAERSGA